MQKTASKKQSCLGTEYSHLLIPASKFASILSFGVNGTASNFRICLSPRPATRQYDKVKFNRVEIACKLLAQVVKTLGKYGLQHVGALEHSYHSPRTILLKASKYRTALLVEEQFLVWLEVQNVAIECNWLQIVQYCESLLISAWAASKTWLRELIPVSCSISLSRFEPFPRADGAKSWKSEAAKCNLRFKNVARSKMQFTRKSQNSKAIETNWNTMFGPALAAAETPCVEGTLKSW